MSLKGYLLMYDSNLAATAASGSATLAMTGMAYASWLLVAVALIALGGTFLAFGKRFKNRKGAKP